MITCANPNCNNEFVPRTVAMKYCSGKCRSETTNAKLKLNYHRGRAVKNGTLVRVCEVCKVTKLSRHNEDETCVPCQKQVAQNQRHSLLNDLRKLGL
jgi:hypothetical protein